MSNEPEEVDQELDKEMQQLIAQEAEAKAAKAAEPEIPAEPSPEPIVSSAPEPVDSEPTPVTPISSAPEQAQPATGKDDPMEWAKKKGFKTPEDMARALLQKEQEFHQTRQQKGQEQPPTQPTWQPRPDMGYGQTPPPPNYGYQPRQVDINQQVSNMYPQLDPEDVKRVMPLIVDAAEAVAFRRTAGLERELSEIRRSTSRNNELMNLMQDPAFRDERVQREIHAVLDADPSIYQRERAPHAHAFEKALANMARKQLQQGVGSETTIPTNKPPVTAGGGNGSASTTPMQITDAIVASWTMDQQDAYFRSNGRIIPKR